MKLFLGTNHQIRLPVDFKVNLMNTCWEELSNHHQRHADRQIEDEIYTSDEFRMFAYKIKRCPRTRSHDWTECPYAHRGEKAQRRDPRRFRYCAIACAAFRDSGGWCPKGNSCEYAHGVFEYWLHPAKYRTRTCNAGKYCERKVCFFAHSPDQLRPETKYHKRPRHHSQFTYRPAARMAVPAPLDNYGSRFLECDLAGLAATPDPNSSMMTDNSLRSHHHDVEEEEDEEDHLQEVLAIGEISDILRNLKGLGSKGSRRRRDDRQVQSRSSKEVLQIRSTYNKDNNINGGYDHHQIRGIGLGLDALSRDEELQRLGWISELLD